MTRLRDFVWGLIAALLFCYVVWIVVERTVDFRSLQRDNLALLAQVQQLQTQQQQIIQQAVAEIARLKQLQR